MAAGIRMQQTECQSPSQQAKNRAALSNLTDAAGAVALQAENYNQIAKTLASDSLARGLGFAALAATATSAFYDVKSGNYSGAGYAAADTVVGTALTTTFPVAGRAAPGVLIATGGTQAAERSGALGSAISTAFPLAAPILQTLGMPTLLSKLATDSVGASSGACSGNSARSRR